LVGLACVLGVVGHGGTQFLHRGGGLFEGAGLFLGAAGQVAVARGDLRAGGGHGLAALAHGAHHSHQATLHALHRRHDAAGVTRAKGDGLAQVTVGHSGHGLRHLVGLGAQGAGDAAGNGPSQRDAEANGDGRDAQHPELTRGDSGPGIGAGRLGQFLLHGHGVVQGLEDQVLAGGDLGQQDLGGGLGVFRLAGQAQLDRGIHVGVVGLTVGLDDLQQLDAFGYDQRLFELRQQFNTSRAQGRDPVGLRLGIFHVFDQGHRAGDAGHRLHLVLELAHLGDLDHAVVDQGVELGAEQRELVQGQGPNHNQADQQHAKAEGQAGGHFDLVELNGAHGSSPSRYVF